MIKKLAKLEYLPNNFKIIEEGNHVICAISGKIIKLEELNYFSRYSTNYMVSFFNNFKIIW